MPLLLIIGGVLVLAGLSLLVAWFGSFITLLKAVLPLLVAGLGGLLAYFGWEERQDRKGALMDFSSPAEANRYQADALAYQESIDQIAEEQAPGSLESPVEGALESPAEGALESPVEGALESPVEGALEASAAEGAIVVIESAPDDQNEATVTVTGEPKSE
ncbi:MAG: hypothetical protein LBE49_04780 [Deltaproteobacteria bacterium]|jgi:hypothetical protein|nr:hypothetical protein [Deltaproteobacteria bacterium]